jgi:hypothetical protein
MPVLPRGTRGGGGGDREGSAAGAECPRHTAAPALLVKNTLRLISFMVNFSRAFQVGTGGNSYRLTALMGLCKTRTER